MSEIKSLQDDFDRACEKLDVVRAEFEDPDFIKDNFWYRTALTQLTDVSGRLFVVLSKLKELPRDHAIFATQIKHYLSITNDLRTFVKESYEDRGEFYQRFHEEAKRLLSPAQFDKIVTSVKHARR